MNVGVNDKIVDRGTRSVGLLDLEVDVVLVEQCDFIVESSDDLV